MKRKIITLVKWMIFLSILSGLTFVSIKTFQGYNLYKKTMDEVNLNEVFLAYQSQEGYVTLEEISPFFLDALVAVEDHRFYEHTGFDEIAFFRAVLRNISEKSYAAGGSTITQQLSKNLFFTFDKTLERKIAELIVAKKIEKTFEKNDILEMYVNIIYYGDGYVGIEAASQGYFRKSALSLSNGESIILAGLPQAPSIYALRQHLERGISRGDDVINAMVEKDFITEHQRALIEEELRNVKVIEPKP